MGVEVGQVSQGDKDTFAIAITTAQGVYDDRVNKTQGQIDAATTTLEDAAVTFQREIITAGDPSALSTAINEASTLHTTALEGTSVGQYVASSKAILKTAIDTAQSVLDDASNKTVQQLSNAKDALDQAVDVFGNGIVKAGDATTLTTAIQEATTLHANAVEGAVAGQYVVGSKATLKAAIDTAQLVLDHASNKTAQQILDAKNTLNQAVVVFDKSKVIALTGLKNVTITGTAMDSSNCIALETGESLSLTSSDENVATVTEDPVGTIKVTGVAEGGPVIIAVQVKKDGVVTKTGVFTVTTLPAAPMSITSKMMTDLDFSTVPSTQAKLVSKPVTIGDFTDNRKDFAIRINGDRIPIYVYWKLSTDFPKGAALGSVVESHIQDFYYQKGGADGIMNRPIAAYGFDDTFQISAFQPGSASSFTLEGADWSYFFEQSSAQGTDTDTSKNRTFTISDGTHTATIQLTSNYLTIDALVNRINNRLTIDGVKAQAEKVGTTQFKIVSTLPKGTIIVDGVNKADFFE